MAKKNNDALGKILTEDAPEQPKSWVCVKRHYNNVRMINVGETLEAEKSPGKHWQEFDPKEGPHIVDKLRQMLTDVGAMWSPDWDVSRLEYENSTIDKTARQIAMREKFRRETIGVR